MVSLQIVLESVVGKNGGAGGGDGESRAAMSDVAVAVARGGKMIVASPDAMLLGSGVVSAAV